ncbi:MAG: RNA polymerase sigma factor [Porticoccaceae bacterium]|nr:RNA polymerase sigma factor [Porticoccaceae bacterium]
MKDITINYLDMGKKLTRFLKRKFRMLDPDIEDIVQETFLRTHQAQLNEHISYPKSFMYTAAKNLAINYLGRYEKKNTLLVGDMGELDVYSCDSSLESVIEADEKFAIFCQAVSTLPTKCRRVFMLKKIYGFSHAEIGRQLNISEKTVERHISKGMARCYEFVEKQKTARVTLSSKNNLKGKKGLRD